jgi:hypothetical protein
MWWISALDFWNGRAIIPLHIDTQMVTDASKIAWGSVCMNQEAHGLWNKRLQNMHSNYRELMAILLSIETFAPQLRGKTVQILTDNVSAAAYPNFQGGPSPELTELAHAVWATALQHNINVCAKHLAGRLNQHADQLSRISNPYQWKLNPQLFQFLDKTWGPHTVDRFADMTSCQVKRYNSQYWDPHTEAVDALAQNNWGSEMNWVNAPFRMIPRVLQIVREQKAEATILAPVWRSQIWFQTLRQMTVAPPIQLPNTPGSWVPMNSMGLLPEPLRNKRWKIYAWRISGNID